MIVTDYNTEETRAEPRANDLRQNLSLTFCHRRAKHHERWPMFELPSTSRTKDFNVSYGSVLKTAQQLSLFVDITPGVLGGAPRIKDTRVPVYGVLNAIEEYGGVETAAKAYRLEVEAVKDALRFAANVLESPIEDDDPDSY